MPKIPDLDFPEMLGQMLYLHLFQEADVSLLSRYRAGGVMVRRRYAKSTRQLVRLISRHQEEAVMPLFVGANFEWGTGNDTPSGTLFPGLMAIGANGVEAAARDYARTTAREARAMGINHVMMPVLDVACDTGSTGSSVPDTQTSIHSFSSDPAAVTSLGKAMIAAFQSNKVMATARHFPGSGGNNLAAHAGLPVISHGRKRLNKVDLAPFRAAVDAGIHCVMVAHLHVPAIMGDDPAPSSLSRKVITNLLRKKLGFNGLVITDDLAMDAITLEPVDACAAAIRAGADLLLTRQEVLRPDNFTDLLRIVEKDRSLVRSVEASYGRICKAKRKLQLFKGTGAMTPDEATSFVGTPEHARVARRVSLGAVTVLRDKKRLLPIKPKKTEKLVVITPRLPESSFVAIKDNWGQLYRTIKDFHPAAPAYVSFTPTPDEVKKAIRTASRADFAITIVAHEIGQEMDGAQAALANAVAEANPRTVCVVLGNPYAARQLSPGLGTVVLTYSNMPLSQAAAADVIFGKAKAKGRLPITL